MVKLSWFSNVIHSHSNSHKPKKMIQRAGESMQDGYPIYSLDQEIKFPQVSRSSSVKIDKNESLENQMKQISDKSSVKIDKNESLENQMKQISDKSSVKIDKYGSLENQMKQISDKSSVKIDKYESLENQMKQISDKYESCKTDDYSEESLDFVLEAQQDSISQRNIRKSRSLGSIVGKERSSSCDDPHEDLDKECSFFKIHQSNYAGGSTLAESTYHKSLFSIGEQSDGEHNDYADDESADHVSSGQLPSSGHPLRAKSAANLGIHDGAPKLDPMGSRSISCEDLFYTNDEVALERETALSHESDQYERGSICTQGQHVSNNSVQCSLSDLAKDDKYAFEKSDCENQLVDSKSSHSDKEYPTECSFGYNDLDDQGKDAKYWSEKEKCNDQSITGKDPISVSVNEYKSEPGTAAFSLKDGTVKNWDGSNTEELNNMRVAAWISQLDVENCNIVEEPGESSNSNSVKESPKVAGASSKRHDTRSSVGMVVAYNYLSTLSPTSSTALMSNLGLIAIPSFSGFAGLKMLNLSGNTIVRITTGSLPKGLHMLNLSKNHISVIEGLRELTRLRVLDLSYNKISRIGHGLASCSMLKELYLAGNKLSEIDGLYRLLKLIILDLRCNRISTSKGLGQLAANYASLQAINLEGNPAQKNVGDEQLKKCLLSLLPHLSYYNNHAVRASGSKEVSDRPTRSFSSQQFDRSFRSGSHSTGHRSSSHGHLKNAMSSSIKSSRSGKYKSLLHLLPKPSHHHSTAGRNQDALHPRTLRRIQSERSFGMI